MHILLIEDSRRLQESLGTGLERCGYGVDVAGDGEAGLRYARHNSYDVIILDLMLPKIDGLTLLRSLRTEGDQTHVLILTTRDSVEDRVHGLRDGADDYLVKPCSFDELLARIEALVRRRYQAKNPVITVGPLAIDTTARTVLVAGEEARLSRREYALIEDEEDEYLADGPTETLVATVALDRDPIDGALATLLGALLVVGAGVALTVTGLVLVGVRWGLRPLDRLRRQLGSVTGPTISRRFDDADTPAELAPVYRELNRMLDRVERTLDRERSFADAAAHELRTPLAELRATAEVALRWPDPEQATTALGEVLAIGGEMERLVESLLLISRGHAAASNGTNERQPIAAIVRACLDRSAKAIHDKRLHLTVDLDGAGTLPASRDAVEIIIRNLIENAVRYTPADGRITIRGEGIGNGHPALVVANDPVGLAEQDLPRLFEPFWRTEGARADRQHVGLGLSVVQQIAGAVGLRVEAGLTGDQLRIRVSHAG